VNDPSHDHPWVGTPDERFSLALVLDVGEVLARHGYDAPTGVTLVELTAGLTEPSTSIRAAGYLRPADRPVGASRSYTLSRPSPPLLTSP
jgi:hypothetical protein